MNFKLLFGVVAVCSITTGYAQKLPNVQQASLRAPANLKIDGKTTEWADKFQAYNHETDIFYTMANDDDNLYLVVHASNPDVLTKITNRGIVLKTNISGKKSDESSASVTFPIFELQYGNKPYIRFSIMGQLSSVRKAAALNPDSVSRVANKKLHDNEKFIRTSGIAGVDTLLSIYDNRGIKVREAFDDTMAYTYELAIPLHYLGLSTSNPVKFSYHILLPGLDIAKDFGMSVTKNDRGQDVVSYAAPETVMGDHLPAVTSTTDFGGEYVLAKH
jgi:hypothetical protein